jgi:RNA-splicing ligase RtcB
MNTFEATSITMGIAHTGNGSDIGGLLAFENAWAAGG